VINFCLIYRSN